LAIGIPAAWSRWWRYGTNEDACRNVRRKRTKRIKSWGDPLSPLFHEGAQNFKSINLSILPRWVAGFRAAEAKLVSRAARFGGRLWGWFGGMAGQIKVRKCAVSAISPLVLCWIAGPLPIGTVLLRRCGDERDDLSAYEVRVGGRPVCHPASVSSGLGWPRAGVRWGGVSRVVKTA
jgi:hypothetical protein